MFPENPICALELSSDTELSIALLAGPLIDTLVVLAHDSDSPTVNTAEISILLIIFELFTQNCNSYIEITLSNVLVG